MGNGIGIFAWRCSRSWCAPANPGSGDFCGVGRGRLGHAPDNPVALGSATPSSIATFPMLMVALSRKTVHQNNVDREFGDLRPVNTKVESDPISLDTELA